MYFFKQVFLLLFLFLIYDKSFCNPGLIFKLFSLPLEIITFIYYLFFLFPSSSLATDIFILSWKEKYFKTSTTYEWTAKLIKLCVPR